MKQTGTFHVYEIKNNQRVVSPIPNAFIYFISEGNITVKTKTDDMGKYDFELPIGEYTVASASEGGIEQILANGSKFILTDQSTEKAFEEWVNAPSADVDEALLKRFKELAKIAEDAAREANSILAEMTDNSIGDGEWVRKTYVDDEIAEIPKPDMSEYRKLSNNVFDDILQVKAKDSDSGSCVFLTDTAGKSRIQMTYTANGWQLVQVHADDSFQIFTTPENSGEFALKADVDKKWDIQQVNTNNYSDFPGAVMINGYGGLGQRGVSIGSYNWSRPFGFNGFQYEQSSGVDGAPTASSTYAINLVAREANFAHQIGAGIAENGLKFRNKNNGSWRPWNTLYHTGNTTVDSNGFIKKASPIIRLFNDSIETNNQFIEEPIFERISEGTYEISNTLGLAQEGWTYEKPRGSDGNPYFRVLVKKTEDGCIISVHDEYDSIEEATITDIDGNTRKINKVVKVLSQARDIKPYERWIDLRFYEDPREEIESSEVVQ